MAARKRSGSGSKRQFKEKVVQIYETILKGEELGPNNSFSWDEFFLLKPKLTTLESEIMKLSLEQLQAAKPNIMEVFTQCIHVLANNTGIRAAYGMQTLCGVLHAIFKKLGESQGQGEKDNIILAIDFLSGSENYVHNIQKLLDFCQLFLEGDYTDSMKGLCLKLIIILIIANDNLSQNTLIEYIIMSPLFECLVKLLSDVPTRQKHGYDVVLIITLLVNYRKYDATNPYVVKLSILDDELALNGYGQVITASLTEFCNQYNIEHIENQNSSWFSSLTNMVGSMFISEEGGYRNQQIRANNSLLLAFYEAVHLNRNFITTLAQTQTDASSPPSPNNTLHNNIQGLTDLSNVPFDINSQPSNLLVTFFQYCSIVMQDTKTDQGTNTVKLCFLILGCISEDQYANSLMHDVSLAFKVRLHRLPMRHRKLSNDKTTSSQSLVCTLLDLLVEFMLSHMMKKFPMELYMLCLGIIQRILCYQKKCRIRVNYVWKELWTGLISLLRFILQNENYLGKKMNIFKLCIKVVNILNFFITYGDNFLPTPGSYDELYYEIIRMHQVFDNVYSMALRYSMGEGDFKEDALKLNNALFNVRAIIKHFNPKIEQWLASNNLSTPTEEQILDIVKKNYDSLTLKLQDLLDHYERYIQWI
ncbi:armadillo-like helical domain-containing protein 3 isoform X2 [Anthonomus grandis grandis]|uniref:armadillo-like helical domain-containing protein 3 isoform X2 n=1 Tax=Anthonomus grandis grandis TaxID=2921223 RepID=UPI0021650247|nr:armadillo-like helical domain-containing protein 3 isoform X2 [Anthonomus grandis grandis]